jgi:hypothetical protein
VPGDDVADASARSPVLLRVFLLRGDAQMGCSRWWA